MLDFPGITQKFLCVQLKLDKSTISRTVNFLIKDNFLVYRKSIDSNKCIFPSDKLLEMEDEINLILFKVLKRDESKVTKSEMGELFELIEKLTS